MTDDQTVLLLGVLGDEFNLLDERRQTRLPVETLRANLAAFTAALQDILTGAESHVFDMKLQSVDVAVGVDAKGQVGFLGTGAEIGGNATLTLRFERR